MGFSRKEMQTRQWSYQWYQLSVFTHTNVYFVLCRQCVACPQGPGRKWYIVNTECKCGNCLLLLPHIGGKFVAIFRNVTKIITLREGECSWKWCECCLWVLVHLGAGTPECWYTWVLVHLVSDNIAIHCSNLVPRPHPLDLVHPIVSQRETHT